MIELVTINTKINQPPSLLSPCSPLDSSLGDSRDGGHKS